MRRVGEELMPWRDSIPVHPAADFFPLMGDSALRELADDIARHGLRERIKVIERSPRGQDGVYRVSHVDQVVIDGRNRLDALELAGVTIFHSGRAGTKLDPDLIDVVRDGLDTDDDINAYVISANIHRRHLTLMQKKDLVAALLEGNPDRSNRSIAELVKVDHKTVGKARREKEARGEIPHVDKAVDSKGRLQPTSKRPAKPATTTEIRDALADEVKAAMNSPATAPDQLEQRPPLGRIGAEGALFGVEAVGERLADLVDELVKIAKTYPGHTWMLASYPAHRVHDQKDKDLDKVIDALTDLKNQRMKPRKKPVLAKNLADQKQAQHRTAARNRIAEVEKELNDRLRLRKLSHF
jgi:hypothetical protein